MILELVFVLFSIDYVEPFIIMMVVFKTHVKIGDGVGVVLCFVDILGRFSGGY